MAYVSAMTKAITVYDGSTPITGKSKPKAAVMIAAKAIAGTMFLDICLHSWSEQAVSQNMAIISL